LPPITRATNDKHSSSSCKGTSGLLHIMGLNTMIFAVLKAWLMSPLHCVINWQVFYIDFLISRGDIPIHPPRYLQSCFTRVADMTSRQRLRLLSSSNHLAMPLIRLSAVGIDVLGFRCYSVERSSASCHISAVTGDSGKSFLFSQSYSDIHTWLTSLRLCGPCNNRRYAGHTKIMMMMTNWRWGSVQYSSTEFEDRLEHSHSPSQQISLCTTTKQTVKLHHSFIETRHTELVHKLWLAFVRRLYNILGERFGCHWCNHRGRTTRQ